MRCVHEGLFVEFVESVSVCFSHVHEAGFYQCGPRGGSVSATTWSLQPTMFHFLGPRNSTQSPPQASPPRSPQELWMPLNQTRLRSPSDWGSFFGFRSDLGQNPHPFWSRERQSRADLGIFQEGDTEATPQGGVTCENPAAHKCLMCSSTCFSKYVLYYLLVIVERVCVLIKDLWHIPLNFFPWKINTIGSPTVRPKEFQHIFCSKFQKKNVI